MLLKYIKQGLFTFGLVQNSFNTDAKASERGFGSESSSQFPSIEVSNRTSYKDLIFFIIPVSKSGYSMITI